MQSRTKTSADFEWKNEEEYYTFLGNTFDVKKAKEIIRKKPRQLIVVDITEIAKSVVRPVKTVDENGKEYTRYTIGHNVDWNKIDDDETAIDLEMPVILAQIKEPKSKEVFAWLIDGWHRVAKANEKGLVSLPGVLLTLPETKKCQYA